MTSETKVTVYFVWLPMGSAGDIEIKERPYTARNKLLLDPDAPMGLKRIRKAELPVVGGVFRNIGIGLTLDDAKRIARVFLVAEIKRRQERLKAYENMLQKLNQFDKVERQPVTKLPPLPPLDKDE